jgi:cell wall-associated NlpC family hydrolase
LGSGGLTPRPQPGTYTVRAGDTLPGIARAVYGDPGRWREVFEANLDALSGPELLTPGQQLQVPTRSRPTPAPRPELPPTPEREARAARFVSNARRFVGQPFRWGGGHAAWASEEPCPVDCSGLVVQAARLSGIKLEGSAAALQRLGREVPFADARAGDLVFSGNPALDVAIALGQGRILHASRTRARVVELQAAEAPHFDQARRVI